jgi:hypothetical protein
LNTVYFLQKLFEGYVRSFASFRWYTTCNYSDLTSKELNHFTAIGERLGFVVRREMNWNYPRDLCWVESLDSKAIPYLYLERESKDGRMCQTIEKMLKPDNSKGIPILVASFGHLKEASFKKASEMLMNGIQADQTALLFAWVAESENASNFEICAEVISASSRTATKAIPDIAEHGQYWYMRFDGDVAQWKSTTDKSPPPKATLLCTSACGSKY